MPSVSYILPVFNEEGNIPELYKRLSRTAKHIKGSYEIIFIDDGSTDNTFKMIALLRRKDKSVKVIRFSRNFGHQAAVTAGLDFCKGKYIAILDADLQDPPEVLPAFISKLEEGYDVVYAIRTNRKESLIKRLAYSGFYRFLKLIAQIDIPLDSGDFCVMKRRVVDTLKLMPERNRFIRGLRSWTGFRQTGLTYERSARYKGRSKYSFRKLLHLAMDGILSFSYIPLRMMTFGGLIAFFISLIGIIVALYLRLFTDTFVPGFATTVILLMFGGGIIILGLGIIGEYLARIYDEVKQRPPYVIASMRGIGKSV